MPQDTNIVSAAIHPAIGIARVGNSPTEYFIGPEVPEEAALKQGEYKDASGALKRQAARFRLYGYNAAGEVVKELTPDDAEIQWTVHLANKKAAWYQFQMAMDIPEAAKTNPARRRNPQITGEDRRRLVIDPGPRTIQGRDEQGEKYHFTGGSFLGISVPLGELRTDKEGHLIVLGGLGFSSTIAAPLPPLDFANNDGWHDDISDGPVDAKVKIGGQDIPVTGSWVSVAPPNYAPSLKTVRTLHDVLFDKGVKLGWYTLPKKVSFRRHIQPIFTRLSGLQWVNNGFAVVFGSGAPYELDRLLQRLADPSAANQEFREQIYSHFRPVPKTDTVANAALWPYFYGDSVDFPTSANALASLTGTQIGWLKKWSAGDFINDLSDSAAPQSIAEVPVDQQPALLDQAALDFCLADAFHPGCELTWIIRTPSLFDGPLRLRRRPAELPEADYGDILAHDVATSPMGPLSMSAPGDLTRWMAVPWQTDTASCLAGYSFFKTTASLPTFWPARVPNDVLRQEDYDTVMDSTLPAADRLEAFYKRAIWLRVLDVPGSTDITEMITNFGKLGLVEERPGPKDLPGVPEKVWVETKPELPDPLDTPLAPAPKLLGAAAGAPDLTAKSPPSAEKAVTLRHKLRQFGKSRNTQQE